MNESFLHYIWQNKLLNTDELFADDGSRIELVKQGTYNTSAGPDFFNAQIKIDDVLWAGNVEIHIQSSDWQRHNHQTDPSYDSCILHVVYLNDHPTTRIDGSLIPTIEIRNRFSIHLWENYLQLIKGSDWLACRPYLVDVGVEAWESNINKMIYERMENRCAQILISLKGNKDDWQETFYQYLAKNFGFQLNGMPFEMLARSLSASIVMKGNLSIQKIEALLFGQAGMLDQDFSDLYARNLQKEYQYFKSKHSLQSIPLSVWKFLRLRPVNFPSVRIAQFACLLHQSPGLLNELIETETLEKLISIFEVEPSEYWNTHYRLDTGSVFKIKKLGRSSVLNILINSCIPFLFAWGKYHGEEKYCERAMSFLAKIPPEDNHLIDRWKSYGIPVENAVDSQALLQLGTLHCSEKKCLTCDIGKKIISDAMSDRH